MVFLLTEQNSKRNCIKIPHFNYKKRVNTLPGCVFCTVFDTVAPLAINGIFDYFFSVVKVTGSRKHSMIKSVV